MMLSGGLEREVRALLDMGVSPGNTSMQAIGYKEMVGALLGDCSIDEAVEKIKMESRRYAKRQLTWLRRDKSINWITWDNVPDYKVGVDMILKHIKA
jgi:tRNA dimethylallyltransferase